MFNQSAPVLGNQFEADEVLRSYLKATLPAPLLQEIEPELINMGELAGGSLYGFQQADRQSVPLHTPWDAWGNRIDQIELTALWRAAQPLAAQSGLVAIAHERKHAAWSRLHQFALVYLFTPSTDLYSCPLAMTDGAATTLSHSDNEHLKSHALPHLITRDPKQFWTSGQWMTESTGGSDVGLSETIARRDGDGQWRLYGRKWFTSAATSQMALTLARPEGNAAGGKGLALFYLEVRDEAGRLNGISVNRLKDKLGTRKVPTAELMLEGARAVPVRGLADGVRNIAPMLNITRTWNSVSCVAYMRRAIALAQDYARRRFAFGSLLAEKPLHMHTIEGMQAEFEAAFHLTFFMVRLLGRVECGQATEEEGELLRLLTPIVKLTTAKQCVAVCSEALECFGGAGYVEDTGLPTLLRDAQVFPIWEGTTNVLSLDALRAMQSAAAMDALHNTVGELGHGPYDGPLGTAMTAATNAYSAITKFLHEASALDKEREARRCALGLGRALALALLCAHARASASQSVARAAARFAQRLSWPV